jgi:hypothetical protein
LKSNGFRHMWPLLFRAAMLIMHWILLNCFEARLQNLFSKLAGKKCHHIIKF